MKILLQHGRHILETEVTNISTHGLWILTGKKELFLSYEQFPWFKDKTVKEITNVESFGENHLYWDELDIDLSAKNVPNRPPIAF